MHFSTLFTVSLCAALAGATPTTARHVLHERRLDTPKYWEKVSRVSSDVVLPMRIGMTQSNLNEGHDMLMDVSRQDSPRYGQHLSAEEIVDFFAPAEDTVRSIRGWLEASGISADRISTSANKQWMQFDAKVEEVEELLKTEYHTWAHKASGVVNTACDEYHVPAHLTKHIDYITPGLRLLAGGKAKSEKRNVAKRDIQERGFRAGNTGNFSGPVLGQAVSPDILSQLEKAVTAYELTQCDQFITPPCIAAMYNITQATKSAPGNQLGIFEEGDFYSETDLALFFAALAPNIPITTMPKLEGVDGGFAPMAVAGGESNLDLQISYPIIYPQNSIIFQTDDLAYTEGLQNSSGFLNTFFDAIDGSYCTYMGGDSPIDPKYPDPFPVIGYNKPEQCGVYKPANVISISYGEQEDDLPTSYQQRQCSEIMKLGMQGVSVILASGDSGVAARSTDDGNADGCLGKGEVFNPDFPASCPYLTAVGATYLPAGGDPKKDQEVAVTRFPSGGGFSNIYARPSYQDQAVNTFFTQHDPGYKYYNVTGTNNPTAAQTNGGIYNRAGRGYPDVSAVGDNVVIFLNGAPTLIGGTSASAPVFAAILNRINEERLAAGKKTVGFVNPTLYAHPEAFNDITNGTNPGCNTNGFSAVKGWDPVTGLGTPNYPALLKVFMS